MINADNNIGVNSKNLIRSRLAIMVSLIPKV